MMDVSWISWPLTVFWIVGVTNAVNLIDGLDGLAAGMALFALVPMMVLAMAKGNVLLALICCSLAGSLLGFLLFNFHPARIFMGDSGSMFLGYTLAVVSLATATKGRVSVALLTPILALGLPILDTLLAIARRAWFGQSLFIGDRQHIHHRLLDMGFSHRSTVLVMYGVAATWALLGLGVHINRDGESALLFFISLVIAAVLLRKVGYLVMPAADGATATSIRQRNRDVRAVLPGAAEQITDRRPAAFVSAIESIVRATGAASATVTLRPLDVGEPERTYSWTNPVHDADIVDHAWSLRTTDGHVWGRISIQWARNHFHAAALPGLEVALIRLTDRYEAASASTAEGASDEESQVG
jgi:UDP-GlcNAc:undecaprenyl-phosphate GlcNAc-1-phosphate transferase